MGIPEMMAQSEDSGGMEGFFNSPIAMILMPRVAARFQAAKKDQMLLQQYQRKVQLAGQMADQIEATDPMAAAMIRADPSTMDNVFSAYYGYQKAEKLAKTGFEYDIAKQRDQAKLTQAQKDRESNSPGGAGYYNKMMDGVVKNVVADSVQGPNMPGLPTAGEAAAQEITPDEMLMALRKDYRMPELGFGNAARLMTDPNAAKDLQANRVSTLTGMRDTKEIVDPNNPDRKIMVSQDPITGAINVPVGEVPKSAEEQKLGSQNEVFMNTDGTFERRSYNPKTKMYDVVQGTVAPQDIGLRDHVNKVFPDGSVHIMLWDDKTKTYSRDDGISPLLTGEPQKDANGNVIGFGKKTGGTGADVSVDQSKGKALLAGIQSSIVNIGETFDSLGNKQNAWANRAAEMSGGSSSAQDFAGFLRTPEGRQARDSLVQIAQSYVYALSGQQAPDQEVARLMALVMPGVSDDDKTIARKKARLADMINTVKTKASGGVDFDPAKMQAADMAPGDYRAPDPNGDSGLDLNAVTAPDIPEGAVGHVKQEDWDKATPAQRKVIIKAFGGNN
jgi:hypothetical protein